MPANHVDAESAAMYKQLLTRPISILDTHEPEDIRLVRAFEPFCAQPAKDMTDKCTYGAHAFEKTWLRYAAAQRAHAYEGRRRFLNRYEYPSPWETAEAQQYLELLYSKYTQSVEDEDEEKEDVAGAEEKIDHDAQKHRATVAQYSALVGDEVVQNLEGLARARLEKHAKPRETDAKIDEAYMKMTSGGGTVEDFDGDEHNACIVSAEATPVHMFLPVPWDFS